MGDVELSIIFDAPEAIHHPGDPVSGHVEFTVEGDHLRGGLRVDLLWEIHGRWVEHREVVESLDPSEGERQWAPGLHTLEFRFTCPALPISYEGEFFDIDLVVRVVTEFEGELPAETTAELRSVLGPEDLPMLSVREPQPEHLLGGDRWDAMIEEAQRGALIRELPGMLGPLGRLSDWLAKLLMRQQRAPEPLSGVQLEYEPGAPTLLVRLGFDYLPVTTAPETFEATLSLYECSNHRRAFGRVEQLDATTGRLEPAIKGAVVTHYEGTLALPSFVALSFACPYGAIRWNLRVADPRRTFEGSFPLEAHLPQGPK